MKILITGGKTATALKLIKAFSTHEILLGDYGDMPTLQVGRYSFVSFEEWNPDVLAHHLLTKCLDEGVGMLLPLYEAEINAIAKSIVLFDEFGIKVLLPAAPQTSSMPFADYCIFDNGELLYASADLTVDKELLVHLNGAYRYSGDTNELGLICLPNPI